MIIHRGLTGRLYPNKEQKRQIRRTAGCCRFVYNQTLEAKRTETKENRLTKSQASARLPGLKAEFPFLKEVDANALQHAVKAVFDACHNHFENPAHFGWPQYKSKRRAKKSYTTSCYRNNIRIEDGRITLPKLGAVKVRLSAPISKNGKILSATITERPDGSFSLALDIEVETQDPAVLVPTEENTIGLDFMMDRFFADSKGNFQDYPKWLRKYEGKLARAQRKLARCRKGSKGREGQRIIVAKINQKIADKRSDFLHKLSRKMADTYDFAAVEDLNLQNLSRILNFGKSIADHGFGVFRDMLAYKLEEKGGALIKVPWNYPSTQLCQCGHKNPITQGLEGLNIKTITCPVCGRTYNRDTNAAVNIRNKALEIYGGKNTFGFSDGTADLTVIKQPSSG